MVVGFTKRFNGELEEWGFESDRNDWEGSTVCNMIQHVTMIFVIY